MIYFTLFAGIAAGMMFFILARMDAHAYYFYFDVIAMIIFVALFIGVLYRLRVSGSWVYFDKNKRNKPLLEFLYRDGGKRPILGERIPGMGLFHVAGLGIVLDIGRLPEPGSVYTHGDKPTRFVLQDINHTPNPKFTNFYRFLTSLGFNRGEELQDVLNGRNPELMAKVWNHLCEQGKPKDTVDKLVDNIKEMEPIYIDNMNKEFKKDRKREQLEDFLKKIKVKK